MGDFRYVGNLPVESSEYRETVRTMNKEELLYHLRYETRADGMTLLHGRANELNVHPVSMHCKVNRIWHGYAGIKGLIETELPHLTVSELHEALSGEHRLRVCQWISKELKRRNPVPTLADYFGLNG